MTLEEVLRRFVAGDPILLDERLAFALLVVDLIRCVQNESPPSRFDRDNAPAAP